MATPFKKQGPTRLRERAAMEHDRRRFIRSISTSGIKMKSTLGSCLVACVVLSSLARPASAGYIQIAGPGAAYDAASDTFSVTGNATIGAILLSGVGTGYQSLVAQIDGNGVLSSGSYSLFGTFPRAGISTPTLLISAQVDSVSLIAGAFDPTHPAAGGGISMSVALANILVDPVLDLDPAFGAWGLTAQYCCSAATRKGSIPIATLATPWANSWSGYFAADYFDIRSSRSLSEPGGLALVGIGLACAVVSRRAKGAQGRRAALG